MAKSKDETGNTYGRLSVIKEVGRKRGAALFLCQCECGKHKEITGGDLRSGKVHSCGCLKSEMRIEKNTTHGLKTHRLYSIYHNMITRCYNEKATHFDSYGGRGISICDEWKNDFISFYNWAIRNGYSDELSIDRIEVNGNYEPSNCRWATIQEQSVNKRSTHFVEINGEVKSLTEWCTIYKIKYPTVQDRIKRGWSEFDALTKPLVT